MYKNILLPIDLDHESSWKKALPSALELCKLSGGTLHVMTVVPNFGMSIVGQYFPKNYKKEMAKKVLDALRVFVKDHVSQDIPVQHIVGEGTVYEAILNTAREIDADLIVEASHRPELQDYLIGPNASRVVRHATCSVLVVRGES